MDRIAGSLLVGILIAGCGGESPESRAESETSPAKQKNAREIEACALLTSEEIQAATGWRPDSAEAETYGTTRTCVYRGPQPLTQSVVLVIATPAPELSSSAGLAEWRNRQVQRQPDLKMVITPVEGLGVPAVRSELEGSGSPTLEAAAGGLLLGVTTSDFEAAKALAPKAIARLH